MRATQLTVPQRVYLLSCHIGTRKGPRSLREKQSAFALFKRGLLEKNLSTLTPRGRDVVDGLRRDLTHLAKSKR